MRADRDLGAVLMGAGNGVGQAGLLAHRQCVHVGTQQHWERLTDQREQFCPLITQGLSNSEACRVAGINADRSAVRYAANPMSICLKSLGLAAKRFSTPSTTTPTRPPSTPSSTGSWTM